MYGRFPFDGCACVKKAIRTNEIRNVFQGCGTTFERKPKQTSADSSTLSATHTHPPPPHNILHMCVSTRNFQQNVFIAF